MPSPARLVLLAVATLSAGAAAVTTIEPNATTAAGGDWLKVSWSSFSGLNYANCWVGMFPGAVGVGKIHAITSGGFPYTEPYASTAPIKFINCTEGHQAAAAGSGSFTFKLRNYRQPVFFAIFDKGLATPVEIARSAAVLITNATAPMHLRLSLTRSAGQMQVGWTCSDPSSRFVQYSYDSSIIGSSSSSGTGSSNNLTSTTAKAFSISTYGAGDLCGAPANADGWFDPGFAFYAHVPPTEDGKARRCFYRVGSDQSGWSPVSSFLQPSTEGTYGHGGEGEGVVAGGGGQSPAGTSQGKTMNRSLQIMLTADVGATEEDGAHYHWEEPDAGLTYRLLKKHAGSAAFTLHVGDLAYATGYESKWENFMAQIEPLSSSMPYMIGHGNHERDWPGTGSYGGRDSGGECGVPTRARFRMPTPAPDSDKAWYSVDAGKLVHVVMIDTEVAVGPGSDQHAWLSADLAAVNRSETPWVILAGHRPMYTGDVGAGYLRDPYFAEPLEGLLVQHGVDLCIWGHVHNVMSTCPVNNGTCQAAGTAPVHVVIGNGGQSLSQYPPPSVTPPEWVDYKNAIWGWNEIRFTPSSLNVNMYSDKDDTLLHTVSLKK